MKNVKFTILLLLPYLSTLCFAQTSVTGSSSSTSTAHSGGYINSTNPSTSPAHSGGYINSTNPSPSPAHSGGYINSTNPSPSPAHSGGYINSTIPSPPAHSVGYINSTNPSTSPAYSIAYINSTNPLIWHNNNSTNMTFSGTTQDEVYTSIRVVLSRQSSVGFVCGFYCLYYPTSCLFAVVAVGGGDLMVVWSANGNIPVSEDATLQLTADGELVLRDYDGVKAWSTNTSGKSVIGMNMTQEGNLVLFNKEGSVVWQSFDHPTDTLLIGQRLYEGQQLTSTSSDTNWSTGLYYATISSYSGFAAYTRVDQGPTQMYYQLAHRQRSRTNDTPVYAEFQRERFLVKMGDYEESISIDSFSFPFDTILFLRLESNGRLKVHRQNDASGGLTEVVDLVRQVLGECQYPRSCGDFGLCRQGQCSCPIDADGTQYYRQDQFELPDQGCTRITPLSCSRTSLDQQQMVELYNVTYFNIIDTKAAVHNIKDRGGCKKACLQNCSCSAAFFRNDQNVSDGYCFMPSKVLSLRDNRILYNSYTMETFIKVRIPYVAPNSVPTTRPGRQLNLAALISGTAAGGFIIVFVAIAIVVRMLKRNPNDEEDHISHIPGMPTRFSYEELRLATEDFKDKIGGGGFGTVFKGVLVDGTQVAVKRLDKLSQGTREFLAEVESIGSIHHFNLVRLIGYCAEKSSRLLVYEFMINGSLDNWIFNRRDQQNHSLDWLTRKKIILDIAKGLAYLHEECRQRILHLDIKPQNILLDENFNAKVSDFGLAKLIDRDESQVQTTMRGTPGYIAPEWRLLRITVKVDIYSFGIVVLETVCGRRNLDHTRSESSSHLLRLLQKKANESKLLDIVEDQNLIREGQVEEVERMIKIGAWCLHDDYTKRPSMSTVVKVLENAMEVDEQNISYNFTHALQLAFPDVPKSCVSVPPEASVLSFPR